MILIPAIDIYKGKIVRLYKGNYKKKKIYNFKIINILSYFLKNNFKIINIIDLEGAQKKKIVNKKIITKIIKIMKKKNIKCQIGGGLRRVKFLKYYFKKGANKLIIGSKALNKNFIKKIIIKFKKKIIISADIYKNFIMTESWKKKKIKYKIFKNKILKYFKGTLIVTNINRDGTQKGIELKFLKKILKCFKNNKIIFSGGYNGKDDIKKLKKKNMYNKIYGYVVGKYIYEKLK
ncbi:HisA/HisF-related TIM barrel protein [Candidatus Vidania fulgoroideorum]